MNITPRETRILANIGRQAQAVAQAATRHETAKSDERAAREELLRQLVANIRPALAACSDRVRVSETKTAEGETHQDATWVGLRVVGDGPRLANSMWRGHDVFVRPDGTFVSLAYAGEIKGLGYSRWSSIGNDVPLADVVRDYDLSKLTDAIDKALVREAGGKRGMRTDQVLAQADRVRALTTILRSWSL
jgi:hypothetical protein